MIMDESPRTIERKLERVEKMVKPAKPIQTVPLIVNTKERIEQIKQELASLGDAHAEKKARLKGELGLLLRAEALGPAICTE
jgi:hypothetical protein